MGSISVDTDTKAHFTRLKPDDATHDEFMRTLLNSYEQHGEGVDPDAWAERVVEGLAEPVATKAELGAFRGAKEGVERND